MERFDSDVIFSHIDLEKDQEQKNFTIFHGLGMTRFDKIGSEIQNLISRKGDFEERIVG